MGNLVSGLGFGELGVGDLPEEYLRVDLLGIASAPPLHEETAIVLELKAGSEQAYSWLVGQYHRPIYSLLYRILRNPADASDVTQEVFLKVVRGIKNFNGDSSLKTWLYRIAVHEACNQRRWWFRHTRREMSIDASAGDDSDFSHSASGPGESLIDGGDSPLQSAMHEEVRARVESELKRIAEPYRTAVILRDIEGLSYEEVADILQISLGTVKSRLTRGRQALRKRLQAYVADGGL